MFYKIKSNVIFRDYKSFGLITDNRNFGYKQSNNYETHIGDKILSESGAIFMSVLDRKPKTLEKLAKEIKSQFTDIDLKTIKNDASDFYSILENDGFIVSGNSIKECNEKDTKFSYKSIKQENSKKNFSIDIINTRESTQDFFDVHFNGKPQLTNLHMEITSVCNERCLHCYIPHENKVNFIDPDLFFDILEQCKNMRLLHLTLSGGEPMLHKNFCDFIRKCNEYNFSVNILSNLTSLNDKIIKEMKLNQLLCVQVSLYSMDSKIHDEITQMKGSFEKTKNAILKLVEYDIPVQISCPIMRQNKNCYEDVIKWAEKHKIQVGADTVIIASYNHTSQNLNCRLSIDEIKEIINFKIVNDADFIEQIKIDAEKKRQTTKNDAVCSVCHSSICIAENGNVYPCAGWQDYVVGNIKNNTLNDIWNNSEKVQYLRGLQKKDFPKCIKCTDREYCTMCMVRNANENSKGDPLALNEYFCSIAKLNKSIMFELENKHLIS